MATPTQATIWGDWIVAPPAPEPPAWLEEQADIQADLEAIEEQEREYAYMLAEEEALEEYERSIEDDHEGIIAFMGGYA